MSYFENLMYNEGVEEWDYNIFNILITCYSALQ